MVSNVLIQAGIATLFFTAVLAFSLWLHHRKQQRIRRYYAKLPGEVTDASGLLLFYKYGTHYRLVRVEPPGPAGLVHMLHKQCFAWGDVWQMLSPADRQTYNELPEGCMTLDPR